MQVRGDSQGGHPPGGAVVDKKSGARYSWGVLHTVTRLDSVAPNDAEVFRFDAGPMGSVTRTPQGGISAPAHLTRSGVFVYVDDVTGKTVREYRPPEEVFHADSLATLRDAPVTDQHPNPKVYPEMVTAQNFRTLSRGHTTEPRQDGARIAAQLVVQDAELVAKVTAPSGPREVSCGYTCRMDHTPGVTPDGQKYDVVQRHIRYNHVAIVPTGRAGADVRLRLDSAGNEVLDGAPVKEISMDSIRIDGVDYPLGTDAERKAAAAAMSRYQVKLDAASREASATQARLDAATAELVTTKAALATAQDPARLDAAVKERAQLHATATTAVKADGPEALARLDSMDAHQLRCVVIGKAFPDIKLDGKDATYLGALFEAATTKTKQDAAADPSGHGRARAALTPEVKQDAAHPTAPVKPSEVRQKMDADNALAWTKPLTFTKG